MNTHSLHQNNDREIPVTRRTALRHIATATASLALSHGATADVPIPNLDFGAAGLRCKRAITLLLPRNGQGSGMTLGQFLYQPFLYNLPWFIDNSDYWANNGGVNQYPPVAACRQPLVDLQAALIALTQAQGKLWPLSMFYYKDFPNEYHQSIRGPFRALAAQAASPWLVLPDKANYPHRYDIEAFLNSTDVQVALAPIEAYLLFVRNRDHHLNAYADPHVYLTARGLFDFGVLHEKGRPVPSVASHKSDIPKINPNDKCWSENAQSCKSSSGHYCELDGGEPTTSSDVCP